MALANHPPMALATVKFVDVRKSYGRVRALRGLSLEVMPGEIYGLLGPNGAGKTTALKIAVGLLRPDGGYVSIHGLRVDERREEVLRLVGYVPENPFLFPTLTVREFLEFVGKLRGMDEGEIDDRVSYYLSLFDLEERERSLIRELSRGMVQKVAASAALLHEPKVLLLDEPMVGMDPEAQHAFKEEVRRLVERGATAVISSHLLDMVERFCTRVGVISRGRLVAEGDLSELRRRAEAGEDATLEEVFVKLVRGLSNGGR